MATLDALGSPVQPNSPVLVEFDGESVPGLVLKANADGTSLLVTFEREGRVSTSWLPLDAVRPAP
ncbi:hypothetical protein [Nocardioides sp. LML1-1-1.1]|uniref:hypothetical protein n=1 Tax=Nocardioides sp. LML1-1-1.1 TaxID=3135248 RepID=UPI00343597D5